MMSERRLPARWRKLDNAAKIFPATSGKKDTRVFRFSCDLKEMIQKEILQIALERTVREYPMFCSVMRKGLFWFYLERSEEMPVVSQEHRSPCSKIYIHDKKSLLFEVTYFKNRINFEVFHALTDGTGAMQFIRELVKNYLLLAHPKELKEEILLTEPDLTEADKENDSFRKYYSKDSKKEKKKPVHSYQLKGLKADYDRLNIMEGRVTAEALLAKSREYGVSLTVFLTAVFLCAIHREMSPRKEKYPAVLMIPVNLRKFFPSESMLNFFGWINAGYRFETGVTTFEDVLWYTRDFFKAELTKERVAMRMNELIGLERNPFLRAAPLEIKNLCLQAGARLSKNNVTAIFSNMGVVQMPEQYARYIEMFHVYTSTPKTELCMCSFSDWVVFSFTSRFESENVQRNFFRILGEQGIEVEMLEESFPKQQVESYPGIEIFKVFSFICLVVAVACAMANILLTPDSLWAVIVSGGIFCMWLSMSVGFYKRRNLLKNAMWQLLLLSSCCLAWDGATGWNQWSADYAVPGLILINMVFVVVISRIQKLKSSEYMIYYVLSTGAGLLIPSVLMLIGWVSVRYLAVLCVGISFLVLAALMIFFRREFLAELHKKFHI